MAMMLHLLWIWHLERVRAPKAKDWLQESQDILRVLKENLQATQNQQKMYADRHRVEHNFEVGDLVFLRLHPYRQSSLEEEWCREVEASFFMDPTE
jgi:hypothetical protein